jgi:5'-3' exonuclease
MTTILGIDLSGMWHAAWHATKDKPLNEAYETVLGKVHKFALDRTPVVVAIDSPPYKRTEAYPEYKANREPPGQDMVDQFRRLRERLRRDGLLVWGVAGYEADDILASLAAWCASNQHRLEILSSDKDLLQLVSDADGISVISPITSRTMRDDDVIEKMGVPPHKLGDSLAMQGDRSDNIPGVPGIGPKTAALLLSDHESLVGIQVAAAEGRIPGKVGASIVANLVQLKRSRELVELYRDVPLPFDEIFQERKAEVQDTDLEPDGDGAEEEVFLDVPTEADTTEETPKDTSEVVSDTATVGRAIARVPLGREWNTALEPVTMRQANWLAATMMNSRLFGRTAASTESALAIIMQGRSLGLDAVTSLRNFHIIKDRVAMGAHLLIGLVMRSPLCEYFMMVESTPDRATYETKRVGFPRAQSYTYTIEEARDAGYLRPPAQGKEPSPWLTRARDMLRKTAGCLLARAVYPDVTQGLYSTEELEYDGIVANRS